MKLFCLTYAGGTAAFYDDLERNIYSIKPAVELIKIEYAGHGNRHKELLYKDFAELADDVLEIIKKELQCGASVEKRKDDRGRIIFTIARLPCSSWAKDEKKIKRIFSVRNG